MRQFTLIAGAREALPRAMPWERHARWLASSRVALTGPHDDAGARPGSRAAPGLADEFEAFYRQHERGVFGYLWRITSAEQTANDLTQEVFLRAWSQFSKVRSYERPDAWLFHIATNLALNELRHRRIAGPVLAPREDGRVTRDHAAGVAERTALRAALEGLPARQRAAIILREIYGYHCDEIAGMLGVSRVAAKMTLSRARERLRALYLKEEAE
jgi:RNA polymerase sigma factor (sigma-70 family)